MLFRPMSIGPSRAIILAFGWIMVPEPWGYQLDSKEIEAIRYLKIQVPRPRLGDIREVDHLLSESFRQILNWA